MKLTMTCDTMLTWHVKKRTKKKTKTCDMSCSITLTTQLVKKMKLTKIMT